MFLPYDCSPSPHNWLNHQLFLASVSITVAMRLQTKMQLDTMNPRQVLLSSETLSIFISTTMNFAPSFTHQHKMQLTQVLAVAEEKKLTKLAVKMPVKWHPDVEMKADEMFKKLYSYVPLIRVCTCKPMCESECGGL